MSMLPDIEKILRQVEEEEEEEGAVDAWSPSVPEMTLEDILKEAGEEGDDGTPGGKNEFSNILIRHRFKPESDQEMIDQLFKGYLSPRNANKHVPLQANQSSRKRKPNKTSLVISSRSGLEIAEARERQLLDCGFIEVISPLQLKRRLPKTTARSKSTSIVGGTGIVKLESMVAISRQLQKNSDFRDQGPGSPTTVAIHSRFIAVGTSRGLIIIFDHFQNVRQVLGNTNESESDGPVTAIDVASGSDFLVCGYVTGRIVLWDLLKGTSLKAVLEAHQQPVVSLRFLKHDKPNVISVDSAGTVNKLSFSKRMGLLYVVDTDLILDGAAGKIPSISVLPFSLSKAKICQVADQYTIVALCSDKITFIISVEPEVKVLYRWPKPRDISAESPLLPSLSFSWANVAGSTSALAPILARGWGKHLQFLEVIFPGGDGHVHSKHGWPVFEEREAIHTAEDTMAVEWLSDNVLAYFNRQEELCVVDTASLRTLESVNVKHMELVYATYKGGFTDGEPARSFANSFRGGNDSLFLLGLRELQTARVQSWTQRVDALIERGEWLEALALALDHYDNLKTAALERADKNRFPPVFVWDEKNDQCLVDISKLSQTNQRTGEQRDVFRSDSNGRFIWYCGEKPYPAEISAKLEDAFKNSMSRSIDSQIPIAVAERVAEILNEYIRLAIANAPASTKLAQQGLQLDLTKSHYQILAGVCIEYCAVIKRTDMLFGPVYQRFRDCGQASIFVELLEPYILKNMLKTLSPEVMHEFVKHFTDKQMYTRVQQCILQMNIKELDFDGLIKLCKKHQLLSAIIYVYNEGLNDYTSPIGILLGEANRSVGDVVSGLENEIRQKRLIGYKLLLYISYCFRGKKFPHGGSIMPDQLDRIRADLCEWLLHKNSEDRYYRLYHLIQLDAKEFLEIFASFLEDPNVQFMEEAKSGGDWKLKEHSSKCPSRLSLVMAVTEAVFGSHDKPFTSTFSSSDIAHFYMFEARQLSGGFMDFQEYTMARSGRGQGGRFGDADTKIMDNLLLFLALGERTRGANPSSNRVGHEGGGRGGGGGEVAVMEEDTIDWKGRQAVLVKLLSKLRAEHYDQSTLLRHLKRSNMNQAAMIIHRARSDYSRVLSCFLADSDATYQVGVFQYIRNESSKLSYSSDGDDSRNALETLKNSLVSYAPQLLDVDAHLFVVLILELFPKLNEKIIQRLLKTEGNDSQRLEFTYLKRLLCASTRILDAEEAEEIAQLLDHSIIQLDNDPTVQERFIDLLCKFEPQNVFAYLESRTTYPLERCLELCHQHGVMDGEAYLLERTGDVDGALSLILKFIEQKLKILKPALRGHHATASSASGEVTHSLIDSVPEGLEAKQTLEIAIEICQRNSDRNQDDHGEALWFALLEKFLKIQSYVKRAILSKQKVPSANRGPQTAMQVALNQFIRMILERMAGCVSLKSILFKIINEHGASEFGDFRETIFGMLSTYSYEQNIYTASNSLIRADLLEQAHRFHTTQSRCLAPPSNQCFYCGSTLRGPPFGMQSTDEEGKSHSWTTSMIMVTASGQTFHESCGKLWQEEVDKQKKQTKSKRRLRRQETEGTLEQEQEQEGNENKESSEKSTEKASILASDEKDETIPANPMLQHDTGRYLARLKKERKKQDGSVSLNQVMESLKTEDTQRNKFLRTGGSTFKLQPQNEEKAKRVGKRVPGSLPKEANKKGSMM